MKGSFTDYINEIVIIDSSKQQKENIQGKYNKADIVKIKIYLRKL